MPYLDIFHARKTPKLAKLFKNFHNVMHNQFQTKVQILKTDNAREYFNSILGTYSSSAGIIHQSSCIETFQQDRIAKRKKKHLFEAIIIISCPV